MKITKGQIVMATSGDYSDYGVDDHLEVLRDFDTADAVAKFKAGPTFLAAPEWAPKRKPNSYGCGGRFLAFLIRERYLEPLPAGRLVEWHFDDYNLDIESGSRS